VLVEFIEGPAGDDLRQELRVKVRNNNVVDEEIVEGVETVAIDEKLGHAIVVLEGPENECHMVAKNDGPAGI
jgi:hypothetical protein